jgi:predicted hydrocarbon binding protein/DNA-binding Lrp family transcriptional regulator
MNGCNKIKIINTCGANKLNMEKPGNFVRLLLDPLSIKIAKMAVYEGKTPTKIAAEIGKSTSLVFLRLKEMEEAGIMESKFTIKDGKITKKYALPYEHLNIRVEVDFRRGDAVLTKEKAGTLEHALDAMPELFGSYNDFILWKKNLVSTVEIADKLGATEEKAEEIKGTILENLEEAFLIAYRHRIRDWRGREEEGLLEFEEDFLVAAGGKFEEQAKKNNTLKELANILSEGEVFLSTLDAYHADMAKKLSKDRIIFLEEVKRPVLDFERINTITREAVGKENWEVRLYSMGKRVGSIILKSSRAPPNTALRAVFGQDNVIFDEGSVRIKKCRTCTGLSGRKVCYFITGLVEELFARQGVRTEEVTCFAAGDKSCTFALKEIPSTSISGFQKVRDLLG